MGQIKTEVLLLSSWCQFKKSLSYMILLLTSAVCVFLTSISLKLWHIRLSSGCLAFDILICYSFYHWQAHWSTKSCHSWQRPNTTLRISNACRPKHKIHPSTGDIIHPCWTTNLWFITVLLLFFLYRQGKYLQIASLTLNCKGAIWIWSHCPFMH